MCVANGKNAVPRRKITKGTRNVGCLGRERQTEAWPGGIRGRIAKKAGRRRDPTSTEQPLAETGCGTVRRVPGVGSLHLETVTGWEHRGLTQPSDEIRRYLQIEPPRCKCAAEGAAFWGMPLAAARFHRHLVSAQGKLWFLCSLLELEELEEVGLLICLPLTFRVAGRL